MRWPGLEDARQIAAAHGVASVGTQHVLLALLSGPDDEALEALREAGVDHASATRALEAFAGTGHRRVPTESADVVVSDRVQAILDAASRQRPSGGGAISDGDVLRALLTTDDPAVARQILGHHDVRRRILDALDDARGRRRKEA